MILFNDVILKNMLSLIAPPAPPSVEFLEEDSNTINSKTLSELTIAAENYLKKINNTNTFIGIRYINNFNLRITMLNLDCQNSKHGYGDSKLTIEHLTVHIDQLFN